MFSSFAWSRGGWRCWPHAVLETTSGVLEATSTPRWRHSYQCT